VRDRSSWASARDRLRAEAIAGFPADLCLRRHADVLRAAAARQPIPHFVGDGLISPLG
jgi:hypothetical protein